MAVSVTVLASGSRGNCAVVSSSRTAILVDAGISCRETFKRMRSVGLDPHRLSAIVISHEHSDHVDGLAVLARKLGVPVYMTEPTCREWERTLKDAQDPSPVLEKREFFHAGRGFSVGDIQVFSFTLPHDAADPVGFTFRAEGVKVAIVTDLGYLPASVAQQLQRCDLLMIESNHDIEMLRGGPYPWSVKQRVMSRVGHLSNSALADFFSAEYDGSATFVVLAHLSEQNNHPEIARRAAEQALGPRQNLVRNRVVLASQAAALAPITL
ncbi:MAG TPA: MBL fold metallo-hydrolase [Terriglobales bacterium]|nr:MBL fold metallo-hydrolase [Terriglobales bacterium]